MIYKSIKTNFNINIIIKISINRINTKNEYINSIRY